jgi:hypothetical protein
MTSPDFTKPDGAAPAAQFERKIVAAVARRIGRS